MLKVTMAASFCHCYPLGRRSVCFAGPAADLSSASVVCTLYTLEIAQTLAQASHIEIFAASFAISNPAQIVLSETHHLFNLG
jgi:hypothetical protein